MSGPVPSPSMNGRIGLSGTPTRPRVRDAGAARAGRGDRQRLGRAVRGAGAAAQEVHRQRRGEQRGHAAAVRRGAGGFPEGRAPRRGGQRGRGRRRGRRRGSRRTGVALLITGTVSEVVAKPPSAAATKPHLRRPRLTRAFGAAAAIPFLQGPVLRPTLPANACARPRSSAPWGRPPVKSRCWAGWSRREWTSRG